MVLEEWSSLVSWKILKDPRKYTQYVPIRNGVIRMTSENLMIFKKWLVKFSDIRND